MKTQTYRLKVESKGAPEFIDITEEVRNLITSSQVKNGFAVIFSRPTTAAIKINENEPLLLEDMARFLDKVASRNGYYKHNDFSLRTENMTEDECPNGHAHCQQLVLGSSETVPIVNGEIQVGRWQSIFLVELDRPRPREVLIQVMGI